MRSGMGARHEEGAQQSFRETRPAHEMLRRQPAPRHVGCVFQEHRVPRHQRRRDEAEHLPVGEVPGHHREDHAQGCVHHAAHRGLRAHGFRGEVALRVFREVLARPGALLHLGPALADDLAHLPGRKRGERVALGPQQLRELPHRRRTLGHRAHAPLAERRVASRDGLERLLLRELAVLCNHHSRGGVHGFHARSSLRCLPNSRNGRRRSQSVSRGVGPGLASALGCPGGTQVVGTRDQAHEAPVVEDGKVADVVPEEEALDLPQGR